MSDENENKDENKVENNELEPVIPAPVEIVSEQTPEVVSESIPVEVVPEIPAAASAQSSGEPKPESAGEPNGGIGAPPTSEPVAVEQPSPAPVETTPLPPPPELLPQSKSFISNLLAKANYALRSRKIKKLEKIFELARWNPTITNDDIQKMLRVSHNTAARYLTELVKQNKLTRLGPKSHAKYKLI